MPGLMYLPPQENPWEKSMNQLGNLITQLAIMKVAQNFREKEAAIVATRRETEQARKEVTAAAMEGWRPAEGEEVRAPGAGAVQIGRQKMMPPIPAVIDLPGTDVTAIKYGEKLTPITTEKGESKPWLYPDPQGSYEIKGRKYSLTSTRGSTQKARAEIFSGPADELINQMAHRHPLEITLIALGPLTNLALALQRDAEGMGYLKEVMTMGGAVRTKGNITPQAEFNFYVDPLAAKRVLESGLPITLVPLDATHQVSLTADLMEGRVRPLQNSFSRLVIEPTGYDSKTALFRGGKRETYLHDPLAVGAVIDPNLVRKKNLSISVEVREGEFYGKSCEIEGRAKNVEVCLEVDREKFLNLFLTRLKG